MEKNEKTEKNEKKQEAAVAVVDAETAKLYTRLLKILEQNRDTSTSGVWTTHCSLFRPMGKFTFNRQQLDQFWDVYCVYLHRVRALGGQQQQQTMFGIAEKPREYLPVLVDIDLRLRDEDEKIREALYTETQLRTIVDVYQAVLKQIVDDCTDTDLVCVVLEKKMYQQQKNDITYLKHGFHLHFPYIILSKIAQETQLIPRVKERVKELKVFEDLGLEDSSSAIDASCRTVPWLLYGCRKSETSDAYFVSKVYDSELKAVSLEKAFQHYHVFDSKEQLIPIAGKVEFFLPRILSIFTHGRASHQKELKRGLTSPIKERLRKERKASVQRINELSAQQALDQAKQLIGMLADYRAEARTEWLTVGWVLWNITEGSPEGLDLWLHFSSRCEDKFDENVCVHEWQKMVKGEFTIGTLRYFASVDNPDAYKKFKEERSDDHIDQSLEGSHNDIAKAMYELYGDRFRCSSTTSKIWFHFTGHIWEQIDDGVDLRAKISDIPFLQKYSDRITKYQTEYTAEKDKSRQVMLRSKIDRLLKIISMLKSSPFKNNIMRECAEVFYDPRFKDKLDSDPHLIAFKNGVYDLKNNLFRPGRPEDYLSKQLPINYTVFRDTDDRVQNVFRFLEQVFPDKDLRNYFLDVSSDIFVGGNHEKIVVFWTGEGDNGKSVTQSIFEKMMGKLAIKLNTGVVTGKKPSPGAAFADLARAGGGVRWAVLEEPDGDESINIGILKNLTGNDSFFARDLFERGKDAREITPMFKLVFICLAEGTLVTLPSGVSVPIELLAENDSVLSWDKQTDGLVPTNQNVLMNKGVQKCITLTMLDGRKITCTPEHKFLTEKGDWLEACKIKPNQTKLKMGMECPRSDDLFKSHDYKLKIGNFSFDFSSVKDRLKAAEYTRTKDDFVVGEECPLFLVREYLAGLFGRYGDVEFSSEKHKVWLRLPPVLPIHTKQIQALLKDKFGGINSEEVQEGSIIVIDKKQDIISFAEKVGFRFSHEKTYRLTALASFLKTDNKFGLSEYLEKTGLDNLDFTNGRLPCYTMDVVCVEDAGEKPVYDINISEPYSNFIANGIVTHNCNKLPRIKHADKAVWNRVRVVPFESTFCRAGSKTPPPETYDEQLREKRFPMDKNFGQKIPDLLEPFAWLLLERRKQDRVRIEPRKVTVATEMYMKRNDLYRQFLEEEIVVDPKSVLSLAEMYELFKEWFRASLPNHVVPVRAEMEEYFVRLWGIPDIGKKWIGHRQRTQQDSLNDGTGVLLTPDDLVDYNDDKDGKDYEKKSVTKESEKSQEKTQEKSQEKTQEKKVLDTLAWEIVENDTDFGFVQNKDSIGLVITSGSNSNSNPQTT